MYSYFKAKLAISHTEAPDRNERRQLLLVRLGYILVIISLLILPFYLFGTDMHIDGDDSHLYFHYPELWIKNIANSSWMSFSSAGKQDQHFFLLPLLYLFSLVKLFGIPSYIIQNLSFSLIFILGFVFFQKLLNELLPDKGKNRVELLFGSMMYIFSPIILIAPIRSYLAPVWLIGVLPLITFLLVRYLKTGMKTYLAVSAVVSVIFSVALNALPWLLGCLLPVAFGIFAGIFLFSRKETNMLLKRAGLWLLVVGLSQAFWLTSFFVSLGGSNSLGGRILNTDVRASFSRTVLATDQGNTVLDPLLNLFHRQIQETFRWSSYSTYADWHNQWVPLTAIFILIFALGILFSRKQASRTFWLLMIAFLVSLFLFTVKVGFFEQIFLAAGSLPGFAMFRNFYNKFALSYTFLYACIITFSLVYIRRGIKIRYLRSSILLLGFLAIIVNAKPFFSGEIINANLQDTAHIQRNIKMPEEYLSFMKDMNKVLASNTNVLDIPFGTSAYTIITEPGTNHAFSGKSPVKLFSGISDFSGNLSFPGALAAQVNNSIINRDYTRLRHILSALHIGYIFETRNIPQELLDSSLFNKQVLEKTDATFDKYMNGDKILASSNENYVLRKIKQGQGQEQQDSFVAATKSFVVPKGLYGIDGGMLSGSLGYLLDDTRLGITAVDGSKKLASKFDASVAPYSLGESISNPLVSSIFVPHNNVYRILSSGSSGAVTAENIATSIYLPEKRELRNFSIGQLNTDDLVQLNNDFFAPTSLTGAILSTDDSFRIYHKGNELSGGTPSLATKWTPGDCSPHGKDNSVSIVSNPQTGEITLTGKDNHNACLYSDIQTIGSHAYTISYEYKTNMPGTGATILQKDALTQKNKVVASPFASGKANVWNKLSYTIEPEDGGASIFLYSGRNTKEAVTSIRNFEIRDYIPSRSIEVSEVGVPEPSAVEYPVENIKSQSVPSVLVPTPPLGDWRQGDCNALDENASTNFSTSEDGIELQAKDNHNACIHLTSDVNSDYAYTVDFDYYSQGDKGDFKLAYIYGPDYPLVKYSESKVQNSWKHVTIQPTTPKDAKRLTLYLYSGTNKKGSASVQYRNFTLRKTPKVYADNLLIRSEGKPRSTPKVTSIEAAPHLYSVNVVAASSDFFLNFLEPYNDGWKLYLVDSKNKGKKHQQVHFTANMYSNGWYVDVDKLCKEQNLCTKNADGSYDMELVAEFTPQRWFYVGLVISGLTLAGVLGYLGYAGVRRYKRRRPGSGGGDDGAEPPAGGAAPKTPGADAPRPATGEARRANVPRAGMVRRRPAPAAKKGRLLRF